MEGLARGGCDGGVAAVGLGVGVRDIAGFGRDRRVLLVGSVKKMGERENDLAA